MNLWTLIFGTKEERMKRKMEKIRQKEEWKNMMGKIKPYIGEEFHCTVKVSGNIDRTHAEYLAKKNRLILWDFVDLGNGSYLIMVIDKHWRDFKDFKNDLRNDPNHALTSYSVERQYYFNIGAASPF